jgi:hypothetical protein
MAGYSEFPSQYSDATPSETVPPSNAFSFARRLHQFPVRHRTLGQLPTRCSSLLTLKRA